MVVLRKDGVKPTGAAVSRDSLISEAVALAPPDTHAVQNFHTFLLNTLPVIILPEETAFGRKIGFNEVGCWKLVVANKNTPTACLINI